MNILLKVIVYVAMATNQSNNICSPTMEQVIQSIIRDDISPQLEKIRDNVPKLGALMEKAHWKYEDEFADVYTDSIRSLKFKDFTKRVFERCNRLYCQNNRKAADQMVKEYYRYKKKIPVCGCIILNPDMTKVILVTDFNKKHQTFPRGKINEDTGENRYECAIREVFEEVGVDMTPYTNPDKKFIEWSAGREVTMFLATNVPENTEFKIMTKKEIRCVKWYDIRRIPRTSYDVKPFISRLKKFVGRKRRSHRSRKHHQYIPLAFGPQYIKFAGSDSEQTWRTSALCPS